MRLGLLFPTLLLPSVLASHGLNLGRRDQIHHELMARGIDLTDRHVVELIKAIQLAGRADDTTGDEGASDANGGLLGSLINGGSSQSTSAATTTEGTTSSSSSSADKDTTTSAPSRSGVTGSSSSTGLTGSSSSLVNSTASSSSSLNSTSATSTTSSAPTSSSASSSFLSLSTDQAGSTMVITKFTTSTPSSTSTSSASTAADSTSSSSGGSSISTPAIIGIAVGVGVVVLSLIACAIWRMKRRSGDDDEIIKWPELNRHGDADTHHALPARVTGQHGIETNPLERSSSNSSSVFAQSTVNGPHSATPMALGGSAFGAASSLEDYDYEKSLSPPVPSMHQSPPPTYADHPISPISPAGYDHEEDYSSMPSAVQMQPTLSQGGAGAMAYDSEEEGRAPQMSMAGGRGAAIGQNYLGH